MRLCKSRCQMCFHRIWFQDTRWEVFSDACHFSSHPHVAAHYDLLRDIIVCKSDFSNWSRPSTKRLLKRPNRVWKVISIFPELFVFLALACEDGLVPPPPFGCEAARRRTERERVRELLGAAGMPGLGLTQADALDDVGSERVFCARRAAGFRALKPPPRFHLPPLSHLRCFFIPLPSR